MLWILGVKHINKNIIDSGIQNIVNIFTHVRRLVYHGSIICLTKVDKSWFLVFIVKICKLVAFRSSALPTQMSRQYKKWYRKNVVTFEAFCLLGIIWSRFSTLRAILGHHKAVGTFFPQIHRSSNSVLLLRSTVFCYAIRSGLSLYLSW